jgi:toxin CptA
MSQLSQMRKRGAIAVQAARARSAQALGGAVPAPLLAVAVALLAAAALWLTLLPPRAFELDVGSVGAGDLIYLRGFYHREAVGERSYRWARGDAQVLLPVGQEGPAIFSGEMYSAPQPDGAPLPFAIRAGPIELRFAVRETERVYRVLLPAAAVEAGRITLRFASTTVTPPGDDRLLAVAVDRLALRPASGLAAPSPAWPLILVQLAAAAATGLLLWSIGVRPTLAVAGACGVALLFAGLNLTQRFWVGLSAWPLATVAASLAAASLAARRVLPRASGAQGRFVLRLWLITLAAVGLRLAGVAMPGFEFHDLDIQSILFFRVLRGEVYLFETAHEFAGGQTFYPSGPYTFILPLLLLRTAPAFALHVGGAMLDALAVPLLALIARELGLGRRAALIAAATLALLPMQFTAIWWGFFTNISGQMLWLLLVWLLLRYTRLPSATGAAMLCVSLSLVLVSHVGVLLLASCTLALTFGLSLLLRPRLSAQGWRGLLLACTAAGLLFLLSYVSFVAAPMLGSAQGVLMNDGRLAAAKLAEERAYIARILPVALWRGMGMLPFLLLVPGLALLWRAAARPFGRGLVAAWALTPLLFFAVEYATLLQVRYLYFLGPLCCVAFGAVLSRLWERPAGRLVVLAAFSLIAWLGLWLWFNAAVIGIKPSLVPLTH